MNAKVLIGVPTGMVARNPEFYDDLNRLEIEADWMQTRSHGQSPAHNRNKIIDQAIENQATHIMFFDDDVSFRPDTVKKLLSHDKDVVTGLYLQRNYPHLPLIFDRALEDGRNGFHFFNDYEKGLIEITNCGLGACLIRTDVFALLDKPYIRLGAIKGSEDQWCDDIEFFNRVRAAGFKLYADLDCPIGHYFTATLWPNRTAEGKWHTVIDSNGTDRLMFAQPYLKDVMDESIVTKGV